MILTYSLRVRDRHTAELSRQARVVNFVWNYCNEVQRKATTEMSMLPPTYSAGGHQRLQRELTVKVRVFTPDIVLVRLLN